MNIHNSTPQVIPRMEDEHLRKNMLKDLDTAIKVDTVQMEKSNQYDLNLAGGSTLLIGLPAGHLRGGVLHPGGDGAWGAQHEAVAAWKSRS